MCIRATYQLLAECGVRNIGSYNKKVEKDGDGARKPQKAVGKEKRVIDLTDPNLDATIDTRFFNFRDMAPIWEVISQVLFYASPVIVPLATVEAHLSPPLVHLYMVNPLATVLQQFRHAMINHATPSAASVLGGWLAMLEPIAIVLGVFVLGFVVFKRTAPYVAENL